MRRTTKDNYKKDPHYPRVVQAVTAILGRGDVVTPVDLFVEMGLLENKSVEDWRFGRVPALERVIKCNLDKASRILRILRYHAEASGLKASHTEYRKWGKGANTPLRFSKSGEPALEQAYSCHFVLSRRRKTDAASKSDTSDKSEPSDLSHPSDPSDLSDPSDPSDFSDPSKATIHILPSFHYDVVYLKTYREYLADSFRILDEALRILESAPEYRFVVEQVILLEEYWNQRPEMREQLVRHAAEGRLEVAPGMYVMPDMNHPSGESMFMQARIGQEWLREHLNITPRTCWIADCWGHHAQLPQILTQCGYEYYVFWRCMQPKLKKNDFVWQGLDGSRIKTHWLARGYGNIRFPSCEQVQNLPDLDLTGAGPKQIKAFVHELQQYGYNGHVLICNGGDFMVPQASAPDAVRRLSESGELPQLRFSTASGFLDSLPWAKARVYEGEFNSSLQGTFTSNIRIKQENRRLTARLSALETLAVLASPPEHATARNGSPDYTAIWKLLLKQQFHDTICGTITDGALKECLEEFRQAHGMIDQEMAALCPIRFPGIFNPMGFSRTEMIGAGDERVLVEAPAFGIVPITQVKRCDSQRAVELPLAFETPYYSVKIGAEGYITSLVEKQSKRELVRDHAPPFGSLAMQMDHGDLWLNFESPLNGGSLESSLTQNHPDPLDRGKPGEIVNRSTFYACIRSATAMLSDVELVVEQTGSVGFWKLNVPFRTKITFGLLSRRIEYETRIEPSGRHYRIRAAFPTKFVGGHIRHEIPFGIQSRGEHEHVAQNWVDCYRKETGLTLLNRGTPGCNVDNGVLMLSLFRSAAMEYKTASVASFGEGVPHTFEYAVMPHGPGCESIIVREAHAYANPLVILPGFPVRELQTGWGVNCDNVFISALRRSSQGVFVRIYEAVGATAEGALSVPDCYSQYAATDGLERSVSDFLECRGKIPFSLRPFEIAGSILR